MNIRKAFQKIITVEVIAALFILLFVYTGISKFLAMSSLKLALKDYPFIGHFSESLSWLVPSAEIIVALLLVLPKFRTIGLYASLVLMSIFTIYLGVMLVFTDASPCTCGGMLQKLTWPQHLIFNLLFIILSIYGIILTHRNKADRVDTKAITSFG